MAESEENQEDRIAWLRDRGIEIEMPEDRKPGNSKKPVKQRFVKIVKVPCDESQAVTELSLPVEDGRGGDQLPTVLRVYFTQGKVRVDDVKDAATKQFTNQEVNVSQSTIDKLSDVGSVETFPLAHPNEHNNNCKVAFYLDEVGQLKKLQPNRRAAQFATLCGFQNVPFVGDMFLGRVGAAPDGSTKGPQNLDFTLAEFSSDASWLKDVVRHNYEAGIASNRVAMESDLPSEDVSAETEISGGNVKWSETSENMDVSVRIPAEITKFTAKDILVKFSAAQLSVKVRNTTAAAIVVAGATIEPAAFVTLLDATLAGSVSVDDCTWSIAGHSVELTLEKSGRSQGMWKKLLA